MIRVFEGEKPAFALETERTSYAFRILETGHPEHLYYGEKIPLDPAALDALGEKRAFPTGNSVSYDAEHPELVLENVCLEFSSLGKGDLREPMLEIVAPDGSRTSDFLYESHAVDDEQPAQKPLPGSFAEEKDPDDEPVLEEVYMGPPPEDEEEPEPLPEQVPKKAAEADRRLMEGVYAGPDIPPMAPVYAGPRRPTGQMMMVYAGPEYFAKRRSTQEDQTGTR